MDNSSKENLINEEQSFSVNSNTQPEGVFIKIEPFDSTDGDYFNSGSASYSIKTEIGIKQEPFDDYFATVVNDDLKFKNCFGNELNVKIENEDQVVAEQDPLDVLCSTQIEGVYVEEYSLSESQQLKEGQFLAVFGEGSCSSQEQRQSCDHKKCKKGLGCNECGKVFKHKGHLNDHLHSHTGTKPYKCGVCGILFSEKTTAYRHMLIHAGVKPYECNICKKTFIEKRSLDRHMLIHNDKKSYSCNQCNQQFRHKSALISHKCTHTGEKLYVCDICNKQLAPNSDFFDNKRIHSDNKSYSCEDCNKILLRQFLIVAEEDQKHGETNDQGKSRKRFKCNVCGKAFRHRGHLNDHLRIHTGTKPYKCGVCGISFTQKSSLYRHMLVHTGEKPYECSICNNTYREKRSLERHKLIHNKEKKYSCDQCNKQFRNKKAFTSHKRTHKSEKL